VFKPAVFVAAALTLGSAAWIRPVPVPITRAFDAPATPYAAGHRGVDFEPPAGTDVRAAGAGIVTFAGRVGANRFVTVQHFNGWHTTYSYLRTTRVHRGDGVAAGAVLGTSGRELHFGLKIDGRYVDPARLFPIRPRVHLALSDSDNSVRVNKPADRYNGPVSITESRP
jgi:murein DD-endopeptidase MepM/ murein hydrolase activator NlpD